MTLPTNHSNGSVYTPTHANDVATQSNTNTTAIAAHATVLGAATSADLTKLHALTATSAELNYVAGVTSAVQAQINGLSVGKTFISVKAPPYNAVGDGSTDDTTAIQAAVTAAKAAGYAVFAPPGIYKLTGTIDARCTITGANQADDFQGIIGAGREATKFVQHTSNIPIFRFSGRYFTVQGFTAQFNTIQTVAQTAGNVFDMEDWIYFTVFDDLLIKNGYQGFNSKNGSRTGYNMATFSNGFSNIRFENNHYIHWNFGGGTGNNIRNIYMGSEGVDRMYRAVQRTSGFEDVWNQLNIEQTIFEDCAFFDTGGDSLIINSLHLEGCKFICGSGERAIIVTNAQGRARIDIGIDECFVGPHKVSDITRSGTTATATIDVLGKPLSGHGIRSGDTIVVSGATEAGYNVTATVTAVPTSTTVQYTVSGSPGTPATIGSGNDYIQMSLGSALGSAGILIIKARYGAEIIDIDVRVRDVRVTGNARDVTFRLASAAEEKNARIKLRNLSTRGQMDNAHLPHSIEVVALSRATNVVTAYTRIPHRLRVGDDTFVATGSGVGFGAGTVSAIPSPHSFTYTSAGADSALVRSSGDELRLQAFTTTQRARTSNVATLTLNAAHGLSVGHRVRVSNTGGTGYATVDSVISAVTSTTISYVNVAANEGTTADTAGSIMILDSGVSFQYLTEPSDAIVLMEADFLYSGCECLGVGTVNAGAAATQVVTHYGARLGDRIAWTPRSALPDGLQVQAVVTAGDTITWRVFNPTAGNIVTGINLVHYQITRG